MNFRERVLGNTLVYKTFKNLVSPPHLVAKTVQEFLQVPDGSTVLDLGCGYGDLAHFYTGRCTYIGIDSNANYIKEARRRNSRSDAEFLVGDVSDVAVREKGPFDLVLMTGVLHHLTDEQVIGVVAGSRELVSDKGRFVAIEPVFSPDQRLSARLLIASDRGRYVRNKEGYTHLLSSGFADVTGDVVHGRLRIPYSHVILTGRHL